MENFYFNECLPQKYTFTDYLKKFCNTLAEFKIIDDKFPALEKSVTIQKLPSDLKIGSDYTLQDIIEAIENKDSKTIAFAYFNRYPIDKHFIIEHEQVEVLLKENYSIQVDGENLDALNLSIVSIHEGILFTSCIHEDVKKDTLSIISEDTSNIISLSNLYGNPQNTSYIIQKIEKIIHAKLSIFEQIILLLGNCIYSTAYERDFYKLSLIEQQSILEEFSKAVARNLASPLFPDTKLVKDVTQSGQNKTIYELRIYTPNALRVYFHEGSNTTYLASIQAKSNPNQGVDIKKAYTKIKSMLLTS